MLLVERYADLVSDPAPLLKLVNSLESQREVWQSNFRAAASTSDMMATNFSLMRHGYEAWEKIVPLAGPFMGVHKAMLDYGERRANADAEFLRHLASPVTKVPLNLDDLTIDGVPIQAEETSVHSTPFYNVTHIQRSHTDGRDLGRVDPKVILFVPASGHNKSLLEDTIRELARSHEVYVCEVQDAELIPKSAGRFGLGDFTEATITVNEVVTAHDPYNGRVEGPVRANNIAVCQPGPGVLSGVAIMSEDDNPSRPATLTAIASPIDTSIAPTSTNDYAHKRPISWFENSVIFPAHDSSPGAGREVYPGYLQRLAFVYKNAASARNHSNRFMQFHTDLLNGAEDSVTKKRQFDGVFFFDISSLTKELYLETVEEVFQKNSIANGEFRANGRLVDLSAIHDTAIIAADGLQDDVCGFDEARGIGQTSAILGLTPNVPDDMKAQGVFDAGHYMFAGSAWKNAVGPWVFEQIRQQDDQLEYTPLARESLAPKREKAIALEAAVA